MLLCEPRWPLDPERLWTAAANASASLVGSRIGRGRSVNVPRPMGTSASAARIRQRDRRRARSRRTSERRPSSMRPSTARCRRRRAASASMRARRGVVLLSTGWAAARPRTAAIATTAPGSVRTAPSAGGPESPSSARARSFRRSTTATSASGTSPARTISPAVGVWKWRTSVAVPGSRRACARVRRALEALAGRGR